MKTTIKVIKIEKAINGSRFPHLELCLNLKDGSTQAFKLMCTGMAISVISNHNTRKLAFLLNKLEEVPSIESGNVATLNRKIDEFARAVIEADKLLSTEKII